MHIRCALLFIQIINKAHKIKFQVSFKFKHFTNDVNQGLGQIHFDFGGHGRCCGGGSGVFKKNQLGADRNAEGRGARVNLVAELVDVAEEAGAVLEQECVEVVGWSRAAGVCGRLGLWRVGCEHGREWTGFWFLLSLASGMETVNERCERKNSFFNR